MAKFIRNCKKSSLSHCGIPGKVLQLIATPVSFPLYKIFNNLFQEGIFPDIWKVAHVSCIWKRSGLKSENESHRAISILPTLSVCEAIMHNRLLSHVIDNSFISDRQAAYSKGDSTVLQLIYMVHSIRKAWSIGHIMHGVYLDIEGAFDKVWHKGLLSKLEQLSIEGSCLDLFQSYLDNRKQIVVIDGCKSTIRDISAGVPQGSRLGPLLFIVYINDIVDNLESEILIFADDTSLLASGLDPCQTVNQLNRDLVKLSAWALQWKVTFKPSKSKEIIFSNKVLHNTIPLRLNNYIIERVVEHRHLGLWLTPTLCWSKHIHEICLKANRKLYILRSVRYLDRSTLDMLYKIQVRSIIDYMIPVYYHTLKVTDKARLDTIQYKSGLLVTGGLYCTSKNKINTELGWETLLTRANVLGLSLFHKIHLYQTRPLVRTLMTTVNDGHSLRNNGCYKQHKFSSIKFNNSFIPYYTKLWNSQPNVIKCERDVTIVKTMLKVNFCPPKFKHLSYGSKKGCSPFN